MIVSEILGFFMSKIIGAVFSGVTIFPMKGNIWKSMGIIVQSRMEHLRNIVKPPTKKTNIKLPVKHTSIRHTFCLQSLVRAFQKSQSKSRPSLWKTPLTLTDFKFRNIVIFPDFQLTFHRKSWPTQPSDELWYPGHRPSRSTGFLGPFMDVLQRQHRLGEPAEDLAGGRKTQERHRDGAKKKGDVNVGL